MQLSFESKQVEILLNLNVFQTKEWLHQDSYHKKKKQLLAKLKNYFLLYYIQYSVINSAFSSEITH